MGAITKPKPVKLFASILYSDDEKLKIAIEGLQASAGAIAEMTPAAPFLHTDYYREEMGEKILRHFILFAPLVARTSLPEIKTITNDIEGSLSESKKRVVNIDPGYISLENIILATTKNYTHRIYLEKGIYADLTLMYHKGSYAPLEWTYPDYREEWLIRLFNRWREHYKRELSCLKV